MRSVDSAQATVRVGGALLIQAQKIGTLIIPRAQYMNLGLIQQGCQHTEIFNLRGAYER